MITNNLLNQGTIYTLELSRGVAYSLHLDPVRENLIIDSWQGVNKPSDLNQTFMRLPSEPLKYLMQQLGSNRGMVAIIYLKDSARPVYTLFSGVNIAEFVNYKDSTFKHMSASQIRATLLRGYLDQAHPLSRMEGQAYLSVSPNGVPQPLSGALVQKR